MQIHKEIILVEYIFSIWLQIIQMYIFYLKL